MRVSRLRRLIDEKDSTSSKRTYFDSKLLPLLDSVVINTANRGKIPVNWTNNNSVKSVISWKSGDMPKFIEMFYDIVNGVQIEFEIRAILNFPTLSSTI